MEKDFQKAQTSAKTVKTIVNICIYTLLVIWALFVLFPFYWMLLTSIKDTAIYNAEVTPTFFTATPVIDNYATALTAVNLSGYMLNTLIYALLSTALMVVVAVPAAYAFARLNFKGKDIVFTIFLSMMMIPNELIVITNYMTAVNLGWRNTFTGLVLPSILSVFYIYLLKENFSIIPDSMYHAARVDGCGDFGYMMKVVVPMSKPTIISIVILKLIECWNNYVWPRLITTDSAMNLVSNGIQQIKTTGFGRDNIPAMMAAVCIVSLPLLVIFIIFRKQIMAGVSRSGTKG